MDNDYSHTIQQGNGVRPLSTALKVLEVLEVMARLRQATRLTEIAALLDVSRPTAYQRLLTLVHAGWVEQTSDGRYRLTLKPVGIGGAALEQANLGERTVPYLKELAATVCETASLAVLQDGHPYIVQRAEEGGLLRARQPVGTGFPLYWSASGRVLYAFADAAAAADIRSKVDAVPEDDICARTRAQGYAISDLNHDNGVKAIAAPVFDHSGACIAALSLVGPETRFNVEAFLPPLLAMAERLTNLLSGRDG